MERNSAKLSFFELTEQFKKRDEGKSVPFGEKKLNKIEVQRKKALDSIKKLSTIKKELRNERLKPYYALEQEHDELVNSFKDFKDKNIDDFEVREKGFNEYEQNSKAIRNKQAEYKSFFGSDEFEPVKSEAYQIHKELESDVNNRYDLKRKNAMDKIKKKKLKESYIDPGFEGMDYKDRALEKYKNKPKITPATAPVVEVFQSNVVVDSVNTPFVLTSEKTTDGASSRKLKERSSKRRTANTRKTGFSVDPTNRVEVTQAAFPESDLSSSTKIIAKTQKEPRATIETDVTKPPTRPETIAPPVPKTPTKTKTSVVPPKPKVDASIDKLTYTVFDFETNGKLTGNKTPDVLSYAAKKYEFDPVSQEHKLLETMDGAYQPNSPLDKEAVAIHGLDHEKIAALRKGKGYGTTFADDKAKLLAFMESGDAVVTQNGNGFDNFFLPELDSEKVKKIDTLEIAKQKNLKTNFFKTSVDGKMHTSIGNEGLAFRYGHVSDPSKLHEAGYDVETTQKAFAGMLGDKNAGLAEQFFDPATVEKITKEHKLSGAKIKVAKDGTRTNYNETGQKIADTETVLKKLSAETANKNVGFKNTLSEFKKFASKVSDDFGKLGTAKKAGIYGGTAAAVLATGAALHLIGENKRKQEQEKLKNITTDIENTRRGGW